MYRPCWRRVVVSTVVTVVGTAAVVVVVRRTLPRNDGMNISIHGYLVVNEMNYKSVKERMSPLDIV